MSKTWSGGYAWARLTINHYFFVCQEPSKRTSIYYTGPKRTRPSPRGCGMGRASVMGTRQLIADQTVSVQKSTAAKSYDPLATMVGRQGNQEQGIKFISCK